jgi:mannose-6-phosphate isomerase-like protein (cupin superfamily)
MNTRQETALKLIPGSHRYGVSLQELCTREGIARAQRNDEASLTLARSQREDAELVRTSLGDGEAILFDGRLWHASENSLPDIQRISLLLQFARADVPVRVPDFREPQWPFRFKDHLRPPVIAVSGVADRGANDVVSPPQPAITELALKPSAHLIDGNLGCKEGAVYEPFPCFFGHTQIVDFVECHTSVLMPGHSPHPPHAHLDEEILVVMDGEGELVVANSREDESPSIFAAPEGSAIYYPSYQHHTIRNASNKPVRYTMIKWKSTAVAGGNKKLNAHFLQSSWVKSERPRGPLSMTPLYEGATEFLGKLHAHISRLQPGAGYAAHRDDHDVAIFLIRGEIAIMGKHLVAPAVVFLPAGSLHDMKACGEETAKYLVWEFHRPQQHAHEARLAEAHA